MNILSQKIAAIEKHISTHSERSVEDIAAVTTLKDFFKYDGKIIPNFAEYDKWPNTDGTFEFVPNPDITRRPEQSFFVQIKGTKNYSEDNGVIKYSLRSLAFPARITIHQSCSPSKPACQYRISAYHAPSDCS